jgi:predicted GIY-YIG superfamily endonuclease
MKSLYTISNPITNKIFYVGITSNLPGRIITHTSNSHNDGVKKMINKLKKKGFRPCFTEVSILEDSEAIRKEKELIISLLKSGVKLLNKNSTGKETSYFVLRIKGEVKDFAAKIAKKKLISLNTYIVNLIKQDIQLKS